MATIQLTPDEAARYKDVPVVLNYNTGFYIFPVRPANGITSNC